MGESSSKKVIGEAFPEDESSSGEDSDNNDQPIRQDYSQSSRKDLPPDLIDNGMNANLI